MARNYYVVLGVNPNATASEIKSAYRQQAKAFHPDHFGVWTEPFLELQEAYTVLTNPERRRAYDQHSCEPAWAPAPANLDVEPLVIRRPFVEPFGATPPPANLGPLALSESFETHSPSFEELFDRLWSNFERITRPKAETIESLTVEIVLTPEQAAVGGHAMILVPAPVPCPTCRGCRQCGMYLCWRCEGEGTILGERPVPVAFPPRVPDPYSVRIPLQSFGIENFYLTVFFRVSRDT